MQYFEYRDTLDEPVSNLIPGPEENLLGMRPWSKPAGYGIPEMGVAPVLMSLLGNSWWPLSLGSARCSSIRKPVPPSSLTAKGLQGLCAHMRWPQNYFWFCLPTMEGLDLQVLPWARKDSSSMPTPNPFCLPSSKKKKKKPPSFLEGIIPWHSHFGQEEEEVFENVVPAPSPRCASQRAGRRR